MKPIVAIIGRPNVGKSTLFNRIIGGRRALTLDVAGVTRDRHYGHSSWDGRDFICIDTGGLILGEKTTLEKKVKDQVDLALREANVILFVMDGRQGLLPDEKEIADSLRRSNKKIFFVVNKIDTPKQETTLSDFFALGQDVHPVSAEHGYRVNDLLDEVVREIPPTAPLSKGGEGGSREGGPIRIAIIGRPNVGKSSLLNQLLGEDRAIVHEEPGTTRDVIDTEVERDGKKYLLLDTAGIRRKGTWASKVERFSVLQSLKAIERADICLLLLDASEGIHKQDAHVVGYAAEAKKGILILWNKWDLDRKQIEKKFVQTVRADLRFLSHVPVHFLSAKTGEGCSSIWEEIDRLHKSSGRRIRTSEVNEVFEEIVASHNPPVYKGRPVKFVYATQTGIHPPKFIVFVSEPEGVHFSFKRYLVNGLRKKLGFDGAPIEIIFRKKN